MAKVLIEVDTEERTCTATLNGKVMEGIEYISIYPPHADQEKSYDGCYPSIVNIQMSEMIEEDVRKHSTVYASEGIKVTPPKTIASEKQSPTDEIKKFLLSKGF